MLGCSCVMTVEEQCVLIICPEAIGHAGNSFLGSNMQKRALFGIPVLKELGISYNDTDKYL